MADHLIRTVREEAVELARNKTSCNYLKKAVLGTRRTLVLTKIPAAHRFLPTTHTNNVMRRSVWTKKEKQEAAKSNC